MLNIGGVDDGKEGGDDDPEKDVKVDIKFSHVI